MPLSNPTTRLIDRRHREWTANARLWTWLLDSYEGGDQYRYAQYGTDQSGYPIRNLVRHKREYDLDPKTGRPNDLITQYDGRGRATTVVEDSRSDFGLRLTRTPVPTMVPEVIEDHLGRIYAKEVRRVGPEDLDAQAGGWWTDVDGRGTTVDEWMASAVAPLLYALGTLDVVIDQPKAPEGESVASQADVRRLGLESARASFVLPNDVLWWRTNDDGSYAEVLIREYLADDPSGGKLSEDDRTRFRHWTADGWTLYGSDGKTIESRPHPYGIVPVVRVTTRSQVYCPGVGRPLLLGVAERQREYYNRDSELILSDTLQAFPLLQGPEDYVNADGTVPIGPGWLLPKKKNTFGGDAKYEGFEVIEFPKGGADSIRENKRGLRDEVDRSTGLIKPAGESGTGAGTVAQSGISKSFDQSALVNRLSALAGILQRAEIQFARVALTVARSGLVDLAAETIEVVYPRQFSIYAADELAAMTADIQSTLAEAGRAPILEGRLAMAMVAIALPGLEDEAMDAIRAEVDATIEAAQAERKANQEAMRQSLAGDTNGPMTNQDNPTYANDPAQP